MAEVHDVREGVDEFTAFVVASGPRLLHTSELLVGDRQAAEDLLQTALTRTYLAWRRVDEPEAYVRRVLARLAVDRWRRRRWREVSTERLPDVASADPAEGVARRDEVLQALAVLTPRERAVVVLRYWNDLTEVQIAEVLRIAPGTVKSTAARALARLRDSTLLATGADHA